MTSTLDEYSTIMKAVASGDVEAATNLSAALGTDERVELYVFGTAVMALCLEDRFSEDAGREAIHRFVEEMRYDYRNAEPPLNFLMIEAYIRTFCGEEHLMEQIPDSEQLDAQFPIIRKIVAQSKKLSNGLDQLMADARIMAQEAMEDS